MPDTFKGSKDSTYTKADRIKYGSARTEPSAKTERTYQHSVTIQSVPTSRTGGEIKLRIAPREIPEPKNITLTR